MVIRLDQWINCRESPYVKCPTRAIVPYTINRVLPVGVIICSPQCSWFINIQNDSCKNQFLEGGYFLVQFLMLAYIYAEDFAGYYSLWRCRPKHFSSPSCSTIIMLASQEIVSSICIFLTSHNVGVLIFLYMLLFYALMKVLKHVSSFRVSLPIESIMVRSSLWPPQQLNFTKLFLVSTGFYKW